MDSLSLLSLLLKFINQRLILLFQMRRSLAEIDLQSSQNIQDKLKQLEETIKDITQRVKDTIIDQQSWVAQELAMKKQNTSELNYPKYDNKMSYYQQFWKVYLTNEILISKIKDYSSSNHLFTQDLLTLENAHKEWQNLYALKSRKKSRRTADKIQKNYICPFIECGKTYGSDVSLNLHMKLKHNSGTKTQRESLARQLCIAQQKGQQIDLDLKFPPGYLEKFKQNFYKKQKK